MFLTLSFKDFTIKYLLIASLEQNETIIFIIISFFSKWRHVFNCSTNPGNKNSWNTLNNYYIVFTFLVLF
jgi:hypothetical protein